MKKTSFQKISPEDFYKFYDDFLGEKSFLQNFAYGEFRENLGEKIFRYGIFSDKNLVGIVQIQKIKTKLKNFLHVPHGPLIKKDFFETCLDDFLDFYKNLGKEKKCDFVRISPLFSVNQKKYFERKKFIPSPVHLVNPEKTWVLDITEPKEEILKNMHKSTRYEIRRIEKFGIKLKQGNSENDLNIFWDLHEQTVKRQNFVPFPKKNTEIQLKVFGANCQIFSASIDKKYYASSIILFDKNSAYYHQGASQYSKAPVSYATIWAAILEAKKRGCKEFNFWGVCEKDNKKHPWYGLSIFKRKFGGEEKNFLHAQDFPITYKYWINFLLEKYRKWKRNY